MKDTELKEKRDKDLYCVYRRGLECGQFLTMRDAAEFVRKQPAPQFYISSREAMKHVSSIESGISLIHLNSESRKRIWTLYDRLVAYRAENPSKSPLEAMEIITAQPAPEFYIGAEMARKILQKERKKARQKWLGL